MFGDPPQGVAALITETTVLKRSTTTSDGNAAKTTLIDSALTEATDNYWTGTVVILSGVCAGQKSDISSFTAATDTITVGTAFASKIVSGVEYAIVAYEPATVEVAALEAKVDNIESQTEERGAGRPQVFVKSITSPANDGDVTVATITTQPCIIDSIIIHADTAVQTELTSAAISGGTSKVVTFINATDAAKANIDAIDEQVSWTGAVRLAATKTIVISLVGSGATAVDLSIIITFHSEVDGGYLV